MNTSVQYGGTAHTLINRNNIPPDEAETIVAGHKDLYKGLYKFFDESILNAKKDGYVVGAYGLKMRTPNIHSKNEQVASGEGRTANNMRSQSYGMLMLKGINRTCDNIRTDEMWDKVQMTNTIHDAAYGLLNKDAKTLKWVNDNLIKNMCKDFMEDQPIKLEAELDIGPSWDKQYTIPNNISLESCEKALWILDNSDNIQEDLDKLT